MDKDFVKENIYLASNIKYLRTLKKMNQKQLGDVFGYSDTTISNWENGTRIPESLDLYRISKYFNIDVDSLMVNNLALNQKENKNSSIQVIKQKIRELPSSQMNDEGKESLISMVDTLNKLSQK